MLKPEELHLTQEWDKTFAKSDRVDHKKVTFINRFGLTPVSYTHLDVYKRQPQHRSPRRPRWSRQSG